MSTLCYLVFPSIHDVLAAEAALLHAGLPFDLAPTPLKISTDCGMVIEVAPTDRLKIATALRKCGLDFTEVQA